VNRIISTLAILVILSGCTFAYQRETLRDSLDARFNRINVEYFHGQLLEVHVRWGLLDNDYGEARSDGVIIIDAGSVKDGTKLDEVIKHESCHIAVGVDEQHGPKWQTCMERFENQ
jgi:hypothetical protein